MNMQFITGFLAGCIVAAMVSVVSFIGIHDNVQHDAYMHGCGRYEGNITNSSHLTFKWCDER